jgi:hypothetical protein
MRTSASHRPRPIDQRTCQHNKRPALPMNSSKHLSLSARVARNEPHVGNPISPSVPELDLKRRSKGPVRTRADRKRGEGGFSLRCALSTGHGGRFCQGLWGPKGCAGAVARAESSGEAAGVALLPAPQSLSAGNQQQRRCRVAPRTFTSGLSQNRT